MQQLYSFEWQTVKANQEGSQHWTPRPDSFTTQVAAERAAAKWRDNMRAEDCPVVCRVVELVSDGKHGRRAVALFTIAQED